MLGKNINIDITNIINKYLQKYRIIIKLYVFNIILCKKFYILLKHKIIVFTLFYKNDNLPVYSLYIIVYKYNLAPTHSQYYQ